VLACRTRTVTLGLSVTDLVKIVRDHGLESHDRTADWFDQVAKDTRLIETRDSSDRTP